MRTPRRSCACLYIETHSGTWNQACQAFGGLVRSDNGSVYGELARNRVIWRWDMGLMRAVGLVCRLRRPVSLTQARAPLARAEAMMLALVMAALLTRILSEI
jgi:hypothetical protein